MLPTRACRGLSLTLFDSIVVCHIKRDTMQTEKSLFAFHIHICVLNCDQLNMCFVFICKCLNASLSHLLKLDSMHRQREC
jgi:hypothetical protein